jgi:hypothetical protein
MPGDRPEDFAADLKDCCLILVYSSKAGGSSGPLVVKGRVTSHVSLCYQRVAQTPGVELTRAFAARAHVARERRGAPCF